MVTSHDARGRIHPDGPPTTNDRNVHHSAAHPLGQAITEGLGGIFRSTLSLAAFFVLFISCAMAIAFVVTHIAAGLGFHPWTAY